MGVADRYRGLLAEALKDDPLAMEHNILGPKKARALLGNEAVYFEHLMVMVVAVSQGIEMVAEEIDALRAAVESRND